MKLKVQRDEGDQKSGAWREEDVQRKNFGDLQILHIEYLAEY